MFSFKGEVGREGGRKDSWKQGRREEARRREAVHMIYPYVNFFTISDPWYIVKLFTKPDQKKSPLSGGSLDYDYFHSVNIFPILFPDHKH